MQWSLQWLMYVEFTLLERLHRCMWASHEELLLQTCFKEECRWTGLVEVVVYYLAHIILEKEKRKKKLLFSSSASKNNDHMSETGQSHTWKLVYIISFPVFFFKVVRWVTAERSPLIFASIPLCLFLFSQRMKSTLRLQGMFYKESQLWLWNRTSVPLSYFEGVWEILCMFGFLHKTEVERV